MRDHDTIAHLDVLHAITDGQYLPSSFVSDHAGKLRLERVEPAGQEQVAIIDGRVLNANQDLTRSGMVRFRNLRESKTFLRFTVFRQLDDQHQRLPFSCSQSRAQSGNLSPNIGSPLFDCFLVASSWITSQCSRRTPLLMRRMSAAIQFADRKPENRPWIITNSPSATIVPCSYLSVGGRVLTRLNNPSRPGGVGALCWL